MSKRVLLHLAVLLVALLGIAGPAHAFAPDPAPGAHTQTQQQDVPAAGEGRAVVDGKSLEAAACTSPCYPNCLYQAHPCWDIWAENYLDATELPTMNRICISERMLIGKGPYDWGNIFDGTGYKKWLSVELGAGWYGFEICIVPHQGHYTLEMGLYPDNPAWHPIFDTSVVDVLVDGRFTWGGYLDPLF